jgi:hypothetical protein
MGDFTPEYNADFVKEIRFKLVHADNETDYIELNDYVDARPFNGEHAFFIVEYRNLYCDFSHFCEGDRNGSVYQRFTIDVRDYHGRAPKKIASDSDSFKFRFKDKSVLEVLKNAIAVYYDGSFNVDFANDIESAIINKQGLLEVTIPIEYTVISGQNGDVAYRPWKVLLNMALTLVDREKATCHAAAFAGSVIFAAMMTVGRMVL